MMDLSLHVSILHNNMNCFNFVVLNFRSFSIYVAICKHVIFVF